jgi:hypothetical protein
MLFFPFTSFLLSDVCSRGIIDPKGKKSFQSNLPPPCNFSFVTTLRLKTRKAPIPIFDESPDGSSLPKWKIEAVPVSSKLKLYCGKDGRYYLFSVGRLISPFIGGIGRSAVGLSELGMCKGC